MSDPINSLNNSVATLAGAGVALGVMGMTRDMVRDATRPQRKRMPKRRMPRRMPPKKMPRRPMRRKSILDDPLGGNW